MKNGTRMLLIVGVFGVFSALLLVDAWQSSIPFLAPGELNGTHDSQRVQVEGVVADLDIDSEVARFLLTDSSTSVAVTYAYRHQRPLTLENGRIAVAKGLYNGGSIQAHQLSIRAHEESADEMPGGGNGAQPSHPRQM